MSNQIESTGPRSGRMLATFRLTLAILAVVLLVAARAQVRTSGAFCAPTNYDATSSSPPGTANWTDTSGFWFPGGSFPGASTCDSATNANFNPTYIVVDSFIPNPLAGINFSCPGCVIEIKPGGTLTIGGGIGSGTGFITNGTSIRVNGGTLIVNTSDANGGVTFDGGGQLELQSGTVTGTGVINIGSTGAMTWGSSTNVTLDGITINSSGSVFFFPSAPASLSLNNGASISNSGTTIFSAVSSVLTSGGGTINNSGNFIKTGSVPTTIDATFNNIAGATGVNIQTQALVLAGGGQGDAPFNINCGACGLEFPSGTYTMGTGGVVSGDGTLSVTGGNLTIGGVTEPLNFTMSGGTLDGPGFLTVSGFFDWSGGTIAGTGGTELAGGGIGNLTGANGQMVLDDRTFNIYGTIDYNATANSLDLANSALLAIYGTFNITDDGSITDSCGGCPTLQVSPNGIFQKTGGTGTSTIEPFLYNDSSLLVSTGTLDLTGGGLHTGSFYAAADATLRISNTSLFDSGSTINADGTIDFAAGDIGVAGDLSVAGQTLFSGGYVGMFINGTTAGFTMTSGDLYMIDSTYTMTGTGTWSEGSIGSDGGTFVVNAGATLTIDSATCVPYLYDVEMVNDGTINYTQTSANPSNYFEMSSATLTNNGTFDMQGDAPITDFDGFVDEVTSTATATSSGCSRAARQRAASRRAARQRAGDPQATGLFFTPSSIVNTGTWKKTGTGTSNIEPVFTNSGNLLAENGTMNFTSSLTQTAGVTTLGPGNIESSNSAFVIGGGTLNGAGTITGTVQNDAGIVAPGIGLTTGVITVTSDYSQGGTATLDVGIAGPAAGQFDQLTVADEATLGGTFTATLLSGYTPAHGTSWPVLTYTTANSTTFATENLPTFPPTGTVTSSYTATAYVLTANVAALQSDLSVGMTGPASANSGAPVSYDITVTNNGPNNHTGTITVTTTVNYSSPASGGVDATGSNTGGWSCGAPGAIVTCTNSTALNTSQSLPVLTITVTAPANSAGVDANAAVSSSTSDPNGANNNAAVGTTVVPQTDLQVTKTGPGGVTAGQNVTYTVVVRNNGPSTATGVTIADPDPANLTFVSNSGACTTAYPCGPLTLTSGQQVTITSTYSTSPSFSGNVTNTATVSGGQTDPNNTNDSASATTNVGAQANLSITKTGPASTTTGQDITYTITYINNGPSPATGTVISDPTPVGIAFQSNTGSCTTPFPCSLGTLAAGQSGTITSTYTVPSNYTPTSISNTASISSATNDPNTGDNSSTAVTNVSHQADVGIVKTGPASASPGADIFYTVTISNAGPASAGSVVVSDPTPAGLTFVSNTGACTTPYPCNIGILTPGQSVSITSRYSVAAGHTGPISNTATVTSGATDSNGANNTSTVVTPLNTNADVSVTKTGPALATPGQNVVYTVTVSNAGPAATGSVVVSDTISPGMTFVSNTGACTSAWPCNLGTLTSGQSATITSTYTVPANYTAPTIVNTASVTAGAPDSNTANNSSSVTTTVMASADLSVTKTGPATFSQGQPIVYTITVTNAGPLSAANTFVNDPTPAGLTFGSNTGACTGPFPCALGTLAAGQTVTITSTFNVPAGYAGATVTNTADVSTSTSEINTNNNSSSTTANVTASSADVSITKTGPGGAQQFQDITFTIVVRNNGPSNAANVVVSDPQPAGTVFISNSGACTTPFPCNLGILAPTQTATINATYRVAATGGAITNTATVTSTPADTNTANNTSSAVVSLGPIFTCPTAGPALTAPANNAVLTTSNVTFTWTSIGNSIGYFLTILQTGQPPITINTGSTTATVSLAPGAYTWFVSAAGGESCRPIASGTSSFTICASILNAPVPSVIGETTTGQTYNVFWTAIEGATTYELHESTNATFTNPTVFTLSTNGRSFTKTATTPTTYYYRARAVAACNPIPGPFGPSVNVVVVPVPKPDNYDPNVNVPDGSTTPVTWQIFIPGLPEGSTAFFATVDRPWLTVAPTSGILPPEGLNFTISADPTALTNGTWTGTIIIVYGTNVIGQRVAVDATTTKTVPVSISLVTPVTPTPLTGASNSAMVVPSVGHLTGVSSEWRSDVRLANLASSPQKFALSFNAGGAEPGALMKQTTISVDAGATTALDDIVRGWYGVGSTGTSSNGLLTVQPLDAAGKPLQGISNVSAVSSRTFNAASTGTLGQFIPGVPFTKFIGGGANAASLSIQQLAQSAAYRTNLGIVEAAGKQASLLVSAFDGSGKKLFDLPLTIQAGEQRLLNSFLANNGVTSLENGRVEVRVTAGDGKVTAYASVVDNTSNDPMLISGTALGGIGSSRFVVPGVADLSGGGANWRSDVRVFNGGAAPQTANLTFYPSGNGAPISKQVSVAPGQIQQLDDVLHSILGVTNAGGALHVTTSVDAPLIVTARTYDQTTAGTVGQFIPAVTTTDAVGRLDRALQILQAEESPRYRTNIGIAEVTGQAATAEITVNLPNTKITPVLTVPLAAFESRQIGLLSTLGLGNSYNARVSVRVINGDGKITAYGSVIDNTTKDPTFIPAQ